MEDEDSRTVWVGNFNPDDTTEEILYELFLQAGPLHYVRIPKDKSTGRKKNFAFICYRHSVSVPYAIELMNGIDVCSRSLKVQSRNYQQLQAQGLASGPGGVHTLDPDFGQVQNYSGPSQRQQGLLQTPIMHGIPHHGIMAMAQQQIALLNAFQPIPLSANPLLNAPKERYSDRHGSLNYSRSNSHNSYHRDNYSNEYRKHGHSNHHNAPSNHYSNRGTMDKSGMGGNMQHHHHGRFDYSRLGQHQNRDHHHRPSHHSDHYSRYDDRQDRHDRYGSESHHNKYNSHRNSGRHHTSHRDSRSYR